MIDTIINILILVKNVAYYAFLFSYKTGQVITSSLQFTFYYISDIFKALWIVSKIVYEDFGVFVWDISERLIFLISLFLNVVQKAFAILISISSTLRYISDGVSGTFSDAYTFFASFFGKIATVLINVCSGIKGFLILFGSGVWFAVTLIPVAIVYFTVMCTYYFGRVAEETWTYLKYFKTEISSLISNLFGFFIDVPFEAFMGLIFAACIFYVLSKFYVVLFVEVKRRFRNIFEVSRKFWSAVFKKKKPEERRVYVQKQGEHEDGVFCVVCKERQKCVLILPCRHLCLCSECEGIIGRYHRKCPICRTYVQKTMKVFT